MDTNPISLIDSIEITFNDVVHACIDGQNNAIMEHQNINEDSCLVCQVFRYKANYTGSDFQNTYGTKHVYDNNNKKYYCHIGELVVNYFNVDYLELAKKLFIAPTSHTT